MTHSTPNRSGVLHKIRSYFTRNKLGEVLVAAGIVSSQDLLHVLHMQKQTHRPLGQILLDEHLVSRTQLRYVLARQAILRTAVAAALFTASVFGGVGHKRAQANALKDISAVSYVTQQPDAAIQQAVYHTNILGSTETKSTNISPFTKWNAVLSKFERNSKNNSSDREILSRLEDDISHLKGRSIKEMAEGINYLMNQKRYITDNRNWGQNDYWATPAEFLRRGGDCEDFAIAKYAALRALGVAEGNLRLAIVQDTVKRIPHAVLIVYTQEGPYILDNQIKTLVNATTAGRYRPIYSINRTAWWLHTAPTETVIAASY